jgi:hypothetical protein
MKTTAEVLAMATGELSAADSDAEARGVRRGRQRAGSMNLPASVRHVGAAHAAPASRPLDEIKGTV